MTKPKRNDLSDAGPWIEKVNRAFHGEPEFGESQKPVDWNETASQARASERSDRVPGERPVQSSPRASSGRPTPRGAARRSTGD